MNTNPLDKFNDQPKLLLKAKRFIFHPSLPLVVQTLALLLFMSQLAFGTIKSTTGTIEFDVNSDGVKEATLNSTGLGIGVTPSTNLEVSGNAIVTGDLVIGASTGGNSTLHVNGTIGYGVQLISDNVTLSGNSVVMVDTSLGNVIITLPYAGNVNGRQYTVKKITSSGNFTLSGGGNYIDLSSSYSFNSGNTASMEIMSIGGQWNVLRQSSVGIDVSWTPNFLTTPAKFWIDASDADTVTLISGNIQSISDKTGNGYTVSAPSSTQRPTQSTWQGRKAIQIVNTGAAGDLLETASNVIGTNDDFTIFSVLTGTEISRGAGANWSLRMIQNHINITVLDGSGNVNCFVFQGAGKLQVAMFDQNARELNLSTNGSSYATNTGTRTGLRAGAPYLQLGTTTNGESVAGYIGEVIVLNRVATNDEKQKIEGYLAWKWGLETDLPAGHPYENSPP